MDWRGWGILAFLYPMGLGVLGMILGSSGGSEPLGMVVGGITMILGSLLGFAHGWWLNVGRPKQKFERWAAEERPRLRDAAARGQMMLEGIRPTTAYEADALIERHIAARWQAMRRERKHTMYLLPLQWVTLAFIPLGIWVIVAGLERGI